jgi:DNA replication protein DnaC
MKTSEVPKIIANQKHTIMNHNQTVEKLRRMRINAMAELHSQNVKHNQLNDITPDDYLALLTDHEWEDRQNKKINRLLNQAHFKQKATVAEISFVQPRNLDKNMLQRLSTLEFVTRKENIILTGASGVGKSYLAQALGHQACLMEHKVLYANSARFFARLKLSKIDGIKYSPPLDNDLSKLS